MSKEWKEIKRGPRGRDLVLEEKIIGVSIWILIAAALIALDFYLHGFRFGF